MSTSNTQNLTNNNDDYYLRSRDYFRRTMIKDATEANYNIYRGNIDNFLFELIYHIYDAVEDNRMKEDIEWLFREILKDNGMLNSDINARRLECEKHT